jgi:hypothetical protein
VTATREERERGLLIASSFFLRHRCVAHPECERGPVSETRGVRRRERRRAHTVSGGPSDWAVRARQAHWQGAARLQPRRTMALCDAAANAAGGWRLGETGGLVLGRAGVRPRGRAGARVRVRARGLVRGCAHGARMEGARAGGGRAEGGPRAGEGVQQAGARVRGRAGACANGRAEGGRPAGRPGEYAGGRGGLAGGCAGSWAAGEARHLPALARSAARPPAPARQRRAERRLCL